MKYFIDTEFLEGKQDKTIFGIKYGETKPTIDLISIGIVAEDDREYYAISKEFNLREAWNRYDLVINKQYPLGSEYNKVYWIRENVLKPIYLELLTKELGLNFDEHEFYNSSQFDLGEFEYKQLKQLINKYGKTNKQIAEEIKEFTIQEYSTTSFNGTVSGIHPIEFYGYYSAYDHVCLSWLFGKMIDLPNKFPMYCIDLKQELDNKVLKLNNSDFFTKFHLTQEMSLEEKLTELKRHINYPKQTDEHNALSDARFNKELYEFLNKL